MIFLRKNLPAVINSVAFGEDSITAIDLPYTKATVPGSFFIFPACAALAYVQH
jgi:hypothetical protein